MKKGLIIVYCFFSLAMYPQQWEMGVVYSPYSRSKITFDKDYIIFNDYTSLIASDKKSHGYFTLFSTGVFTRYRWRNMYVHTEINLFENKFKKQLPGWLTSNEAYFTYSAVEIPVFVGLTLNPGSLIKINVFGGMNNKIGRFSTVYFSSLSNTDVFSTNLNGEYYPDAERKKELMNKFSLYYVDVTGGIGLSYYGTTVDLRIERNLTNLNKIQYDYNANFAQLQMIRLCFTVKLYRPWKMKQ